MMGATALARTLTRGGAARADAVADERALVQRGRAGDPDAFARLVERHQTAIYNLMLRMTRDPQEAADLTQEAFIRAWRSLPGFRAEAKFSTWLYRIAYNVCLSRRVITKAPFAAPDAADCVPIPEREEPPAVLLRHERHAQIRAAIQRLSPPYRVVLDLYYYRECTYEEIAAILDLPLNTVKTHLRRAKAALKEQLAEVA